MSLFSNPVFTTQLGKGLMIPRWPDQSAEFVKQDFILFHSGLNFPKFQNILDQRIYKSFNQIQIL